METATCRIEEEEIVHSLITLTLCPYGNFFDFHLNLEEKSNNLNLNSVLTVETFLCQTLNSAANKPPHPPVCQYFTVKMW